TGSAPPTRSTTGGALARGRVGSRGAGGERSALLPTGRGPCGLDERRRGAARPVGARVGRDRDERHAGAASRPHRGCGPPASAGRRATPAGLPLANGSPDGGGAVEPAATRAGRFDPAAARCSPTQRMAT